MIYIYLFSFFPSLFIALYFIFAHESRMTNNLLDLVYCYRGSCCFFFFFAFDLHIVAIHFLTPVYAPYLKAATQKKKNV